MIEIRQSAIDPDELRKKLFDPAAGAYCSFEGWIRNENEGQAVLRLEYEAYEPLALSEGETILGEAQQQFPHLQAHCRHRTGLLEIGECAVWVGVSSPHRDEAFQACRFIIDQLKHFFFVIIRHDSIISSAYFSPTSTRCRDYKYY